MTENQSDEITLEMICFGTDGTVDSDKIRVKVLNEPIKVDVRVKKVSPDWIDVFQINCPYSQGAHRDYCKASKRERIKCVYSANLSSF